MFSNFDFYWWGGTPIGTHRKWLTLLPEARKQNCNSTTQDAWNADFQDPGHQAKGQLSQTHGSTQLSGALRLLQGTVYRVSKQDTGKGEPEEKPRRHPGVEDTDLRDPRTALFSDPLKLLGNISGVALMIC